jgi:uncharacterized protein involved in exopolysaccharide biosynthesis
MTQIDAAGNVTDPAPVAESGAPTVHRGSENGYRAQGPDIGLNELFRVLRNERRLFIGTVAVCLAAALTLALTMEPVYRAQTLLIPANDGADNSLLGRLAGQYSGLASLAGIDLAGESTLKAESVATLTSRTFLEEFIRERQLTEVIFSDDWDAKSGKWKIRDPEKIPTVADAARAFDRRIMDVTEDRKTGLLRLSIDWTDREVAARWANELVARLNEHMRRRAIAESEQRKTYLKRELAQTSTVEIQQGIFDMLKAEIGKTAVANVRQDFALRVVDPALTPTLRDKVRPKRLLIMIGGLALGLTLATALALLKWTMRGTRGPAESAR